jgi:hypothetical protein
VILRRLRWAAVAAGIAAASASACARPAGEARWTLGESAREPLADPELQARVFAALDAARTAGTDPSISKFNVRAATVIRHAGVERTILGGNSEYRVPEAIHGETSLMNHVITTVGPEEARRSVGFIAFHAEKCGGGGSCGDCRDYLIATTRWQDLLMVCGQASDRTVHVDRFAKWVVPEESFPEVKAEAIGVDALQLQTLADLAVDVRKNGVRLFTPEQDHLGVALLTNEGRFHSAAGADDAAFHYRYPLGAALQQSATHGHYFVQAVAVAGQPERLPRVSYRDRQYGYEFSSFNRKRGLPPIRLILVMPEVGEEWRHRYRMTTFEEALPGAFSAADFMPEAVDRFLERGPSR